MDDNDHELTKEDSLKIKKTEKQTRGPRITCVQLITISHGLIHLPEPILNPAI